MVEKDASQLYMELGHKDSDVEDIILILQNSESSEAKLGGKLLYIEFGTYHRIALEYIDAIYREANVKTIALEAELVELREEIKRRDEASE
jgi:hypothetical protein